MGSDRHCRRCGRPIKFEAVGIHTQDKPESLLAESGYRYIQVAIRAHDRSVHETVGSRDEAVQLIGILTSSNGMR